MKLPGFVVSMLAKNFEKNAAKRRPEIFSNLKYENRLDINYMGDDNFKHCFDAYYAPKEKKLNKLIIDIHGGAYILSTRKENYIFGEVFLEQGFDFFAVDYRLNDGTLSVADQISDCVSCINYVCAHAKELGVEQDEIYLTGDSAGGHFALLIAEMSCNEDLCKKMGLDLKGFKPKAVLVNCSVFDLESSMNSSTMTKGARRRMFGPTFENKELAQLYSPMRHPEDLKLPVFGSSCKRDFIRAESMKLVAALKDKP
ncbi:MAG: alpha/beta hydrolase, partial [Bacilli bacterium]|nr:alpha/beta hydrolase [Bacilli bacterium]